MLVPQLAHDKTLTVPELAALPLLPFLLVWVLGAGAGAMAGVATGDDEGSFRFKELLVLTTSISSSVEERVAVVDCKALLYMKQPEQAGAPPVPSHLPSPRQVP